MRPRVIAVAVALLSLGFVLREACCRTGFANGDFVEYPNEAWRLVFGPADHLWTPRIERPPLVPRAMAAALAIASHALGVQHGWPLLVAMRLVSVLAGLLLLGVTYRLACALFDPAAGAAAVVLLALNLRFVDLASETSSEVIGALFVTASLLALAAPGRARTGAAGALLGLAITARYQALQVAPAMLVAACVLRGRDALAFLAGLAVPLAGVLVHDRVFYGDALTSLHVFLARNLAPDAGSDPRWHYLTESPHWMGITGPLVFALGLAAIALRRDARAALILVAPFALAFAALTLMAHSKQLRYAMLITPAGAVVGSAAMASGRLRRLAVALIVAGALGSVDRALTRDTTGFYGAQLDGLEWLARERPYSRVATPIWSLPLVLVDRTRVQLARFPSAPPESLEYVLVPEDHPDIGLLSTGGFRDFVPVKRFPGTEAVHVLYRRNPRPGEI